jgi:hypothetical protein
LEEVADSGGIGPLPSLKEVATKKPAALRGEPADRAIGFDFAYWLSLQNIESPTPMFAPLFGMKAVQHKSTPLVTVWIKQTFFYATGILLIWNSVKHV